MRPQETMMHAPDRLRNGIELTSYQKSQLPTTATSCGRVCIDRTLLLIQAALDLEAELPTTRRSISASSVVVAQFSIRWPASPSFVGVGHDRDFCQVIKIKFVFLHFD
jgi:hypothetical protein